VIEIDPKKTIQDVYILQNQKSGMIYGLRIVDDRGETLVDENWNKFSSISTYLPDSNVERHFKVPPGHDIIGCHGSTDGQYIRSLGFIIWQPNPATANYTNSE